MSTHIGAEKGQIAETVLLPGDPLRAKFVAEHFLQDAVCYNQVRGMLGYTGTYKGKRVSVQGTGMGMPSHSIYVHELICEFGVKQLVRIGSCGALQPDIRLRDLILATCSSTNSAMNKLTFKGMDFAPAASFRLLKQAYDFAEKRSISVRVGGILSSDSFYDDDNPEGWKLWAAYGVLAVEMETSALYTLSARFGVDALSILTVSDSLVSGEASSSAEREKTYTDMMEMALDLA
ncbi:MAG: purine-nucleoside phosphorylase [Spirochaetales bacterium]|nr:purine-nucleoside phosphorylase [Spirochaetales bacterium]